MRLLRHPIVEAAILILAWILCLLYGKPDAANVYAGF